MIVIFFILSGLSDAVVVSWLVKHQTYFFFSNAETVVTDVALVMGFISLFCFVLQIVVKRREYVPYILYGHSRDLINHRSVTQSKKMILQCIFFTDIYLLVICILFFLFVCFIFMCFAFVFGGQTGLGVVSYWRFIIVTEASLL